MVATSLKSGTTWMRAVLAHLILGAQTTPSIDRMSPWSEVRWGNLERMLARLEAQQQRRFDKTHLPLDGLPFHPQVRSIVVGRNTRDVFRSLGNLLSMHTQAALALKDPPGFVGAPTLPGHPRLLARLDHARRVRVEAEGRPYRATPATQQRSGPTAISQASCRFATTTSWATCPETNDALRMIRGWRFPT